MFSQCTLCKYHCLLEQRYVLLALVFTSTLRLLFCTFNYTMTPLTLFHIVNPDLWSITASRWQSSYGYIVICSGLISLNDSDIEIGQALND